MNPEPWVVTTGERGVGRYAGDSEGEHRGREVCDSQAANHRVLHAHARAEQHQQSPPTTAGFRRVASGGHDRGSHQRGDLHSERAARGLNVCTGVYEHTTERRTGHERDQRHQAGPGGEARSAAQREADSNLSLPPLLRSPLGGRWRGGPPFGAGMSALRDGAQTSRSAVSGLEKEGCS